MASKTGRTALIEQLIADGFEYMFGNPGTVEQGFLDALGDFPALKYVLTLQESIAVLVADGYARAARRPALVQVHSSPGVGNAIGNLYQAKRGGTPLVVIAGDSGLRYDAMEAQMAADLVAMATPVTKWATRVVHPSSLLRVLRRAVKVACTPPMGPVFVCLPADVLDAPCDDVVQRTTIPSTRVVPAPDLVDQAARLLADAVRPMIIMGDGVSVSGGQAELAHLAEVLGAEVWGANSSEVNLSALHPLYRGLLGHMFGGQSRAITSAADVVLIVGTYVFPEVYPALSGVFASGARLIHIDLDAHEIGKNFPVDLGFAADPKLTLGQLAASLDKVMTPAGRDGARARTGRITGETERQRTAAREADRPLRDAVPLRAARFMEELAEQLPADAIVFDEALTTSPELTRYLPPVNPGSYFQTRGGSLGVGIPGAIGAKLANPERTVVGITGDGGSMYTIQALWTAAHHRVGAKFVICNNGSYRLLKFNLQEYWRELELPARDFPPQFDLGDPAIRFVDLAASLGVPAVRVETPADVGPAIRRMLAEKGPFLVDLVLAGDVPGHFVYHKAGQ